MSSIVFAQATGTWPYVAASWIFVFGGMGAYALVTVIRGRRLSQKVSPEKRRWS
ncbi:MAG: hypothetical protein WEA11_00790 [Acidimicrobiales bacterium]